MPFSHISLYGPILPLLIWTAVTALCGLLLVIEAVVLAVRVKGTARWLAVVPLTQAVAAFVLANRIWLWYLGIACPGPTSYVPPIVNCQNPDVAAQAVAQFQPLGWATVGVTAVLLVAGIVVMRQARRPAS
jgi:hypothetical protein